MNNIEDVHKLSFVFMDSLDLNIKHGINVDFNVCLLKYPFFKFLLIYLFDFFPLRHKLFIFTIFLQFSEFVHMHDPFISF